MSEVNRHFYLYAKGHYLVTDTLTDLLKIQSYRTGVDIKSLRLVDVYVTLMSIVHSHLIKKWNFTQFMQCIEDNLNDGNEYREACCKAALTILMLAAVKDIPFTLDEADEKVLPLKEVKSSG